MAANIGGGRIPHPCDVCGGVDDHPRHILAGNDPTAYPAPTGAMVRQAMAAVADLPEAEADRILAELTDASTHYRHYDCCRDGGICPNGICAHLTKGAETKRGAALVEHLGDAHQAPRKAAAGAGHHRVFEDDESIVWATEAGR